MDDYGRVELRTASLAKRRRTVRGSTARMPQPARRHTFYSTIEAEKAVYWSASPTPYTGRRRVMPTSHLHTDTRRQIVVNKPPSFPFIVWRRLNSLPLAVLRAIGFVLCLAGSTNAEEKWPSDWDRFRLWDRCRPMDLQVFVDEGAAELGLTKDAITNAVRSRLRSAGLYAKGGESELFAGVQVLGTSFQVNMYYRKKLLDTLSMQVSRAITWQDGNFGTHKMDSQYILVSIYALTDVFVDEYLRVNGVACQEPLLPDGSPSLQRGREGSGAPESPASRVDA